MTRYILFFAVIFSSFSAISQENYISGYIITDTGDTVKGLIDYRRWDRNPTAINFKSTGESVQTTYVPDEIHGFGVNEEAYVSATVEVETSPVSVEELEDNSRLNIITESVFLRKLIGGGEKSLYEYINEKKRANYYILVDNEFQLLAYKKYIRVQNNGRTIAENTRFLGQLVLYLEDCASISSRLEQTTYTSGSLLNLFNVYYTCMNIDADYQRDKFKIPLETGLIAGVSFTSIDLYGHPQFDDVTSPDYGTSANFSGGIYLNMLFGGRKRNFIFRNELLYSAFDFKHESRSGDENIYSDLYVRMAFSFLKLNSMIRFNIPAGRVLLFVNGGISYGRVLSENNRKIETSYVYSQVLNNDTKAISFVRKYERGYVLGAGANYRRFSLEGRFEKGDGMSNVVLLSSSTNRYYMLLGYRISK